jgi:hypothetical protein
VLTITVPGTELWDEESEQFINTETFTLELEHSLVSLSKWESIVGKPFLGTSEKTTEEVLLYVQCMAISTGVPSEVYVGLTKENYEAIDKHINAKMTATWFREEPNNGHAKEIITAELIYYWMFSAGIPIECENWHLNRLFTLIKVFAAKQNPGKKPGRKDLAAQRSALNKQRMQQLGTRG